MLRYHVRSRDLITLIDDIRTGKLIMSPYFQRNLVWRDVHKKDFIDTILLGLPFPQIFIAQGDIDVDTLTTRSVIVDGQQRVNSIKEFVHDGLQVNGRTFDQLDESEKDIFLRYQVPVIDLDIKASDPQIIDIFKRLNRTFYALSSVEKMSTEYATVDLMLIAKHACRLLGGIENDDQNSDEQSIELHPLLPEDFIPWAEKFEMNDYQKWLLKSKIFSEFEIARIVHLMFTLNIITTVSFGFFPRNDKTKYCLDQAEERFKFRDEILDGLNKSALIINEMRIPDTSIWYSKSNSFSLMIICFWHGDALRRLGLDNVKNKLLEFAQQLPGDYALAAREGVNNRKERILRHDKLADVLGLSNMERRLQ